MAKLPALVTALAEVDGRDRATIDHIARVIREAGYIPTSKRGLGAEDMTVAEAANLIIALAGADTPKMAPTEIDRFRSLRQWRLISGPQDIPDTDNLPEAIVGVAKAHTFGEALEALIEGAPGLIASLYQYFKDAEYGSDRYDSFLALLRLQVFGLRINFQRYSCIIQLYTTNGSEQRIEYETKFMVDQERLEAGFYGKSFDADRRVSVTIGLLTIYAAWQALHKNTEIAGLAGGGPS